MHEKVTSQTVSCFLPSTMFRWRLGQMDGTQKKKNADKNSKADRRF
jgi:hypothetical protein